MGRYYSGDIEGKFAVAVQPSNDADFFGVEGHCNYLSYYFDEDNLNDIKKGVKECQNTLGENKKILDEFFEKHPFYNNEDLKKYFKDKHQIKLGTDSNIRNMLGWYSRLHLGEQIQKCVEKNGSCSFEAEI